MIYTGMSTARALCVYELTYETQVISFFCVNVIKLKYYYIYRFHSIIRFHSIMLAHSIKAQNGKSVLLFPFNYLGQQVAAISSRVFTDGSGGSSSSSSGGSGRHQNDKNNKMREAIIGAIINDCVPVTYYHTERWRALKTAVDGFLHECFASYAVGCGDAGYSRVECIQTAGRGNNYDFSVKFFARDTPTVACVCNIEFKFNAAKVSDTPQFVSPMKPSQYLSASYEEYFYDKYLMIIAAAAASTAIPDRAEWLKQIHNNAPVCVKHLQDKYYAGCANSSQFTNAADDITFYELCKKVSTESIRAFISDHDLDIVKLTKYLCESQDGKTYMLFQPAPAEAPAGVAGAFAPTITLQRIDPADYIIVSCVKNPAKSRYECETESGKKINVLLRWKNGNGIAFPAFQIS
jgi:hypothetical protein